MASSASPATRVIEQLPDLVNANAALVRRGKWFTSTFMLEVGEQRFLVAVREGRIAAVTPMRIAMQPWEFAIRAPAEVWQQFWQPMPRPGFHDIMALLRYGRMTIEGNLQPLLANLLYVKMVLEAPRHREAAR